MFEVRPGIIDTDMTAPVREAYDPRIADGLVPERRWGQPEDVGAPSPRCCAATCRMLPVRVIHVDGGLRYRL